MLFAKNVFYFLFCLLANFDHFWIARLLAISKQGDPVGWVSNTLVPADVSCHCCSLLMGLLREFHPLFFLVKLQLTDNVNVRQSLTHPCLSWCWCLTWHQHTVMPSWHCVSIFSLHHVFPIVFTFVALKHCSWICTLNPRRVLPICIYLLHLWFKTAASSLVWMNDSWSLPGLLCTFCLNTCSGFDYIFIFTSLLKQVMQDDLRSF